MIREYIKDPNILNIYQFGSHVYGTATPESDIDLILVCKEWFESNNIDVHVYTVEQFQSALDRHDIQSMECIFAPSDFCHKCEYLFTLPEINLHELRKSISTICNNSWVKGKKKLVIAGDYDLNCAIKSVFHSIRIYDFGMQIAASKKIFNFKSMNFVLDDLKLLSEQYQRDELWNMIETKYKKIFNLKATEFKKLAPKDLTESNRIKSLENVLIKHMGTLNENLRDEILYVLKN